MSWHNWRAVQVHHVNSTTGPFTLILHRCSDPGCTKLKTKRVDGHWQMSDLVKL